MPLFGSRSLLSLALMLVCGRTWPSGLPSLHQVLDGPVESWKEHQSLIGLLLIPLAVEEQTWGCRSHSQFEFGAEVLDSECIWASLRKSLKSLNPQNKTSFQLNPNFWHQGGRDGKAPGASLVPKLKNCGPWTCRFYIIRTVFRYPSISQLAWSEATPFQKCFC